jgi:hypothetical protein
VVGSAKEGVISQDIDEDHSDEHPFQHKGHTSVRLESDQCPFIGGYGITTDRHDSGGGMHGIPYKLVNERATVRGVTGVEWIQERHGGRGRGMINEWGRGGPVVRSIVSGDVCGDISYLPMAKTPTSPCGVRDAGPKGCRSAPGHRKSCVSGLDGSLGKVSYEASLDRREETTPRRYAG